MNFSVKKIEKIIPGSRTKPILLDVRFQQDGRPKPLVIFSHGFKGFKDWGHFNALSQYFANQGFVFVKLNFSFNGTTPEDPNDFVDLEAFGNNNFSTELDDLGLVIDWALNSDELKDELDPGQLNLIGHSRGGGITILKAAEDKRVRKIATWAAVSDFKQRMLEKDPENWKKKGVYYVLNGRTGQQMPIYYQYAEDLETNWERLNIRQKATEINIPWLIVHGTKDEAVPMSHAEKLKELCPHADLLPVENAGHTFGGKHPWQINELPEDARVVADTTIAFFLE